MESVCSEQDRSATLLYLVIALLKLIYCELLQKTSSQQQTSRSQSGKKIAEFQTVIKGCWRQHFKSQMYQALESLSGETVERILLQSQRQSTKKCTLSRNFALASVGYQKTGSWFSRQWKQASCGRGKPIPHRMPGLHVGSGTARRDEDSPYYSERDIGDAGVMLSTHQLLSLCSPHADLDKSGLPFSAVLFFFFFSLSKFNQEFALIPNSLHVNLISSSDSYF